MDSALDYRLGVGLDWGVVALEYFHYFSAGINDPYTGGWVAAAGAAVNLTEGAAQLMGGET